MITTRMSCMKEPTWFMDFTPGAKCRKSLAYVQSTGLFTMDSNYCIDREKFNTKLIAYTLAGTGHLKYDGCEYTLKEGNSFIIDCSRHHVYYTDKQDSWQFIWIHFNGISEGCIETILENGPVYKDDYVRTLLERIQILNKQQHINYDIYSSLCLNELCGHLMLLSRNGDSSNKEIPPFVSIAVTYMEENYMNKISLDQICQKLKISKYYFCRTFKQYMQCSPHEYLINYRINHAKLLLKTTNMTVEEIAYKLGFYAPSHFIKSFSARENTTPLKYRTYHS